MTEKYEVSNDDVIAYLSVVSPGLMAISPELFQDAKQHLQKLIDDNQINLEMIKNFTNISKMFGKIDD